MKVVIQETDLSYIVRLIAPRRKLARAILKSQLEQAADQRAFFDNELRIFFVEWGLALDVKDRLIQEFFDT